MKLIDKYGYLGEELIGKHSFEVHIMLLHFDSDTNNRILLPILNKALEDGLIIPNEYALILDRHSFFQNNNQKYWMWPCSSKIKKLPFSESDLPKIKKNRQSIGVYGSEFWQEKKSSYWVLNNTYNY